ncbi:hypothetical protein LTS18_003681 [Coniosporium uncinatum]|uniref:Uncharacterized protein n=1 Tax=Coniosporium uncinatum TaxID=93489 RepID=A0ACC3DSX7_9PEZI|nr:hypothetical protein LTS18_003681 [Coniosporium uncinatum]
MLSRASSPIILDGALATALESLHGLDISTRLWSAAALTDHPDAIADVHYAYFRDARADIGTTASYQASLKGLREYGGFGEREARALVGRSVRLVREAVGRVEEEEEGVEQDEGTEGLRKAGGEAEADKIRTSRTSTRKRLVAGSVGPYGAYLSNGAEYTGAYSLSEDGLMDFHRGRIEELLRDRRRSDDPGVGGREEGKEGKEGEGVDVLACETMPHFGEVKALVKLLRKEFPGAAAWFSFTLKDEAHVSDGTALADVVEFLDEEEQVVAVGVNCVPIDLIAGALRVMKAKTGKPLIVYPNSGEVYDGGTKEWSGNRAQGTLASHAKEWAELGARIIGGCCRTTPEDIKALKKALNDGGG